MVSSEQIGEIRARWQTRDIRASEPMPPVRPQVLEFAYQDVTVLLASVDSLQSDNTAIRSSLKALLDVALWARECTPDTLYESFGDIEQTIARAEAVVTQR